MGTLEGPAGVTAREERGLFLDLGLDGGWRKSSGISFQLSMAEGTGVEAEGTRGGAEVDFGGGGRLSAELAEGGSGRGDEGLSSCRFGFVELGFLSQPFNEDCSMARGAECYAWVPDGTS